jgi:hypothetical protein
VPVSGRTAARSSMVAAMAGLGTITTRVGVIAHSWDARKNVNVTAFVLLYGSIDTTLSN